MSWAMEMKKGILLTYIMSAARVTHWYRAMMVAGILEVCTFTGCGLHQTVFPLREPRLGPKMCSAARMSCLVMGQYQLLEHLEDAQDHDMLYEISSSTLPLPISKIKLMFSILWPLSWSIISTTCLVTLTLCLSPFSLGGSRNVQISWV